MTATTILMLSVDEAHLLERSLPAAVAQPDAEVVVIDNACSDRTATLCEEHGARRVALRERRSYAAAINAGLASTSGTAVLLLNADCVLEPGFLDAAVYFDPLDASAIARGIREALEGRADLAARGRARAARFSWRRTADETAAVYRELL